MTTTTEQPLEPITLAIQQVADIITANAQWQESIERYSDEESREFVIKSFHKVPEGQVTHPWAIIFELPGMSWTKLADGVSMPSGQLFLHLLMPEDSTDTELEERRFNNWHGQIAKDLAKTRDAGYVLQLTMTDPPTHTAPQDRGAQQPFWSVGYTINWDPFG